MTYQHHQVMLIAGIALTLTYSLSLFIIALGRSSTQHPVSSKGKWIEVLAGHLTLVCPFMESHRRILITGSSLFLQKSPAYLFSSNSDCLWDGMLVAIQLTFFCCAASRCCPKLHTVSLCSFHQASYINSFFSTLTLHQAFYSNFFNINITSSFL